MLKRIHVENFILIDKLELDISSGLSMITGETGAGKSILLGALGLIKGKRADLSTIRDTSRKCIVEAIFDIDKLDLKEDFNKYDLDYELETIVRREILPSGKSRAFINDTPVTLTTLAKIGTKLIDIHSQHQTLELGKDRFQLEVLQSYVDHKTKDLKVTSQQLLRSYQAELNHFKSLTVELKQLKEKEAQLIKESDYNQYLFNELDEAQLDHLNFEELEKENEQLSNIGLIRENLEQALSQIDSDEFGILLHLRQLKNTLQDISSFDDFYNQQSERISSLIIELEDVNIDLSRRNESIDDDPERLETIAIKLQELNNLFKKHQVDNVESLIQLRDQLGEAVFESSDIQRKISNCEEQIQLTEVSLRELGSKLYELRKQLAPEFSQEVTNLVKKLGMLDAQFEIKSTLTDSYYSHGMDEVGFYFSANKGLALQPIEKSASGGELSRLMLCIKALFSEYKKLPTIVFDEIDTGVSGAIAEKMASIMKSMSDTMQVITITHLPQIAASGDSHFLVSKTSDTDVAYTTINELSKEERVEEIAQMLSGGKVSVAARNNARVLLG